MNIFNSENVNIITLLVTIIGFYFAYFQYFKIKKERKTHLLKILDGQLNCLGLWVGSENGDGYGNELTDNQKFENSMPGKIIYDTGSSPLIDATTILEGMSDVPEEIIGEINQLYYDLIRIVSIQNYRNLLTTSDINLSASATQRIIEFRSNNPQTPFHHFLMSYKDGNNIEKRFIEQLVSYGQTLHCVVIGNVNHGACQHWTKIKGWVKSEKRKELEPDIIFILITAAVVYSSMLFILHLFSLPLDKLSAQLLSVIVTIIFSFLSKAITCEYFANKLKDKNSI